jgi:RecJ-like exonuclease
MSTPTEADVEALRKRWYDLAAVTMDAHDAENAAFDSYLQASTAHRKATR